MLAKPKTLDHVPLVYYGQMRSDNTFQMIEILVEEFAKKLIATRANWHKEMDAIVQEPKSIADTIKMLQRIGSDANKITKCSAHAIGSALFHFFRTIRMANADTLPFIPRVEALGYLAVQWRELMIMMNSCMYNMLHI